MKSIELNYKEDNINKIENFIEDICNELNIEDTFLGNMIIAVIEIVNMIEKQKVSLKIDFIKRDKSFNFKFFILDKDFNCEKLFMEEQAEEGRLDEDSVFLINALCDDLKIDKNRGLIELIFLDSGVKSKLSKHRREYLNKYLSEQIRVNL